MTKPRHIKTVYERFSHHKVENLEKLKVEVISQLRAYFDSQDQKDRRHNITPNYDVFKAMKELNISYSGKFYISNYRNENTKFWSDVDSFHKAFEKCVCDVKLKGKVDDMMEVQVIASDFKDAVLLVYKDRSSFHHFNVHILRDKHSELLLDGNIAHDMSN